MDNSLHLPVPVGYITLKIMSSSASFLVYFLLCILVYKCNDLLLDVLVSK